MNSEGIAAKGTQVGIEPLPYRMDYRLDARQGFITRRLEVSVEGEDWSRRLVLEHDGDGDWKCSVEAQGFVDLYSPGADQEVMKELREARDCDLGLSPVTNLMPIRRNKLNAGEGSAALTVAWVSVPDLRVSAHRQRYEFLRSNDEGSVVRFIDLVFTQASAQSSSSIVMDLFGSTRNSPVESSSSKSTELHSPFQRLIKHRPISPSRRKQGGHMRDQKVLDRINELALEEHELWGRESKGQATAADRARLDEVAQTLDQCWDLLHQRRARRSAGMDPDEAKVRNRQTVEGYIG